MRRALVAVIFAVFGCASSTAPSVRPPVATSSPVAPAAKSAAPPPPAADADGDGIPDVADKCPDERETLNGWEDEDGCPDERFVDIGDPEIKLDTIHFASGTTKFVDASKQTVHDLAQMLLKYPEFALVELDGFADDQEPAANDVKLSLERAKVVMAAFVAAGVDAGRLRVMGFGAYCPLELGSSVAARERNRRVEVKILRTNDGLTGLTTGCGEAGKHGLVSPPP